MRSSMPLRDISSHTQSQKHISSLLRPDHGTAIYDESGNREAPQLIDSLPTIEADDLQATTTDLSSGLVQSTTNTKRYVQKEDWDFHKTTIIRLYRGEDRPLKDVMHIMASRYDFHATVKMYKSRLTAWNVRKYTNWVNRETACQSMGITRGNNNELGTMVVGGNPRNRQVFLRHTRNIDSVCKKKQSSEENLRMTFGQVNLGSRTPQPHMLASTPMYPAGPEKIIEMVCRELSSMIVGAPSELTWLFHINPLIRQAGLLARGKKYCDAQMMLEGAELSFKSNIIARPAGTLLCLLENIAIIDCPTTCAGPFAAFYRCLFEHIRRTYGPQHSLTRLSSLLFQLGRLSPAAKSAYQLSLNMSIDKHRHQDQRKVWYMKDQLVKSLEGAGQHEEATSLWLQAVDACEQKHFSNKEYARACFRLVDNYLNTGMCEEAKRTLLEMREQIPAQAESNAEMETACFIDFRLSRIAKTVGDSEAAERHYRLSLRAAATLMSGDDLTVQQRCVDALLEILRNQGQEEEAEEVLRFYRLKEVLSIFKLFS
jgi:tetratricopeptide (TPR) repeat protein